MATAQQTPYLKHFAEYDDAYAFMVQRNRRNVAQNTRFELFCVVPGPNDNYAVVDLSTAIELELGYVFDSETTGWVNNPWN